MGTSVLGLIVDPGLREKIARKIVDRLPQALSQRIASDTRWQVQVSSESLPLDSGGQIQLIEHSDDLKSRHHWDYIVYLTLPRRIGNQPLIYDVNLSRCAALVSLPALGSFRVCMRVLKTLVHTVGEMVAGHRMEATPIPIWL